MSVHCGRREGRREGRRGRKGGKEGGKEGRREEGGKEERHYSTKQLWRCACCDCMLCECVLKLISYWDSVCVHCVLLGLNQIMLEHNNRAEHNYAGQMKRMMLLDWMIDWAGPYTLPGSCNWLQRLPTRSAVAPWSKRGRVMKLAFNLLASSSCSIMAIKAKNVSISWKHN